MPKLNPKLPATKPQGVYKKSLQLDLKELFKALSKGIGHTVIGKWEEISNDTAQAMSAIGLATEPGDLAFLLIRRALTKALFELVAESASQQLAESNKDAKALGKDLDFSNLAGEIHIDSKFLDRPSDLPLIKDVQLLLQSWLESNGVSTSAATAIIDRLPSYFVYALNLEWRKNAKSYQPLLAALDTPFTKAGDREWAWTEYAASLERRIHEGVFDEPFGLSQIYVPLQAYYLDEIPEKEGATEPTRTGHKRHRVVISLEEEFKEWLQKQNQQDAIRVLSGGPGSGKSSFARIFAAMVARERKLKVLFVPLHLIDPTKDLVEEVGRFVRDEGILLQNPP